MSLKTKTLVHIDQVLASFDLQTNFKKLVEEEKYQKYNFIEFIDHLMHREAIYDRHENTTILAKFLSFVNCEESKCSAVAIMYMMAICEEIMNDKNEIKYCMYV